MKWILKMLIVLVIGLVFVPQAFAAHDALDEVNAWRSKRGLRPFMRHVRLSETAATCADYRAAKLIEGHPSQPMFPVYATEGCGAADDHWGWLSCCQDENWQYAGAAWTRGRDGQRYMTLHVTNQSPPPAADLHAGNRTAKQVPVPR